ncbi:hypothetical protein SAMN04515695_5721 [Pseudovibrio sp. Tun.PSC04-5.I4]|nr:hypothetical protein SAMN04515695_5721 [Pseudovibrio sp. Tun.PSC04-5.I4]
MLVNGGGLGLSPFLEVLCSQMFEIVTERILTTKTKLMT